MQAASWTVRCGLCRLACPMAPKMQGRCRCGRGRRRATSASGKPVPVCVRRDHSAASAGAASCGARAPLSRARTRLASAPGHAIVPLPPHYPDQQHRCLTLRLCLTPRPSGIHCKQQERARGGRQAAADGAQCERRACRGVVPRALTKVLRVLAWHAAPLCRCLERCLTLTCMLLLFRHFPCCRARSAGQRVHLWTSAQPGGLLAWHAAAGRRHHAQRARRGAHDGAARGRRPVGRVLDAACGGKVWRLAGVRGGARPFRVACAAGR